MTPARLFASFTSSEGWAMAFSTSGVRTAYDFLIVGAGFAGSVIAERLATQAGKKVLICDRRPHIGGNAYDHLNDDGVLVHRYGPHIFHTNSAEVFGYLSQFTKWRPYEHRVVAQLDGKYYPMPINRTTVNMVYGLNLQTEEECAAFLETLRVPIAHPRNSEEVAIGAIGRELYQKFIRGYTRRHWGLDPSQLDASVVSRIPSRTSRTATSTCRCTATRGCSSTCWLIPTSRWC
jgi:UDP-galactopyranose mutase